jgi:hypothetical protein
MGCGIVVPNAGDLFAEAAPAIGEGPDASYVDLTNIRNRPCMK